MMSGPSAFSEPSSQRHAIPGGRAIREGRALRAIGRRAAGVLFLLVAALVIFLAALGAAVFTILAAPWRPRLGRTRRVVAIAAVYSATEITGLAVASWRRVRYLVDRDAQRERRDRVRSLKKALQAVDTAAERFAGLKVVLLSADDTDSDEEQTEPPPLPAGPLIVCGRHGGVGGAFLLAHLLLSGYGRVPRVVLKQTLAWDPLIDSLLSGIPHAFIDPQPGDHGATAQRIGALADGMGADDALLIFPEGGNFTVKRHMRAIRRLRQRGLNRAAARAAQLKNVLPPHPDGLLAAIEAAPDADVVFVAHTGLDHLQSAADVVRSLPLPVPVAVAWWSVPAREVPRQTEAGVTWLQDQWSRIDGWVAQHQAGSPEVE